MVRGESLGEPADGQLGKFMMPSDFLYQAKKHIDEDCSVGVSLLGRRLLLPIFLQRIYHHGFPTDFDC